MIGIMFSIFEFIFRIPSVVIGFKTLGYSAIFLQIIWISMNFISSGLLSSYIYGEVIGLEKMLGMLMILGGVYLSSKE